ncbi:alpha/beta hydrolase fold protein [Cylindrobasidium torrendii FP15055 ss-10]|uniref:Alpha/beta hydrolase fold protein n=1 Tax=Cylindrobasidium torrendii FP15055 ss-10 TaxID=1314674 RepID=A0A0D7BEP2_9AGAR|nr:alpha/beta hydrolase fold protein [Cylindrobasidium torrendii FP15055 ss-10]
MQAVVSLLLPLILALSMFTGHSHASRTTLGSVDVNGISVFYREAGPSDAPILLLLHGFPSSSHQYRDLIPKLADNYHIIAPDFPAFGFTTVPASLNYTYTFASLANTLSDFLDALEITSFAVYIFDYGAPVGLRLALQRPDLNIKALITQNGNAYEEGLGDSWAPIRAYWKSGSAEDREVVRSNVITASAVKAQYVDGTPSELVSQIAPETYTLDWATISSADAQEIQLDLFYDYRHNVELYPQFQEWLRQSGVPVLAIWGANDAFFVWAGAEAYAKDVQDLQLVKLDAGHFAVESHTEEIANNVLAFLKDHSY